jgi:hypothetical protein
MPPGKSRDARHAEIEPPLDGFAVADAAAQLHMAGKACHDALDGLGIDRAAGKAAIQIDDVEKARACLGEQHRLRGGIIAIDGRALHIPLGEAHDLAALEVDRRKDDEARNIGHGRHSRKRLRKARP